jgi:hypothetical protein
VILALDSEVVGYEVDLSFLLGSYFGFLWGGEGILLFRVIPILLFCAVYHPIPLK